MLLWPKAVSKSPVTSYNFHLFRLLRHDIYSDLDILSFYLSGLTPVKVHSFGSLHHFKKSKKPVEAGDAKRCLDCAFEKDCVWSAKKIYVDGLKDEGHKVRFILGTAEPGCGKNRS